MIRFGKVTIEPQGGFGTPLKGDTIFGHFCWQVAHDERLLGMSIESLLSGYDQEPKVVFSSAFPEFVRGNRPAYALKRPDLPLQKLFHVSGRENRKAVKKRRWMIIEEPLQPIQLSPQMFIDNGSLMNHLYDARERDLDRDLVVSGLRYHNSIDRSTGTTGEAPFAPYAHRDDFYRPQLQLAVFVVHEENIEIRQVEEVFRQIGAFGFGRDASSGLGRFEVNGSEDLTFPACGDANACYTLAPSVPGAGLYRSHSFVPFVRFGRHGDALAKASNPFKNPVIMADEGAVFFPKADKLTDVFSRPYVGKALRNLSKAMPGTVGQGYSPYLPIRVEV